MIAEHSLQALIDDCNPPLPEENKRPRDPEARR